MPYDTTATDRQMFRDWCASYDLDPAETTDEDVDRFLTDVPGARSTQIRRRASAEQIRKAATS